MQEEPGITGGHWLTLRLRASHQHTFHSQPNLKPDRAGHPYSGTQEVAEAKKPTAGSPEALQGACRALSAIRAHGACPASLPSPPL